MKEPAQESERKIRFLLEPMNEQASERTNEQTEGFTTQQNYDILERHSDLQNVMQWCGKSAGVHFTADKCQ